MTIERAKELEPLLKSEEFAKEIKDMTTTEEIIDAFAAHGMQISEDEIFELGDGFNKAVEETGELSEEELSNVAGGFSITGIIVGGIIIGTCYLAGRILGAVVRKKAVCRP